jgi:hypothetical protein
LNHHHEKETSTTTSNTPSQGINILALKRSASIAEPTQEQQAPVSIEKPEIDAAPEEEPVAHKAVDELDSASCSVSYLTSRE